MGPARIYPWKKMHRSRVPSIAPGAFFVAQSWADCITNMAGFDLRQAQLRVTVVSTISSQPPMIADELRRQADVFTDLVELRSKLGRDPSECAPQRRTTPPSGI
jgi:hypothetical protein